MTRDDGRTRYEGTLGVWAKITMSSVQFSSVQLSGSVVSDSLRPHGLQHALGGSIRMLQNSNTGLRLPGSELLLGMICIILDKSFNLSKPHLPHRKLGRIIVLIKYYADQ